MQPMEMRDLWQQNVKRIFLNVLNTTNYFLSVFIIIIPIYNSNLIPFYVTSHFL